MKVLWVPHAPWKIKQRAKYLAQHLAEFHDIHVLSWDALEQLGDLRNIKRIISVLRLSETVVENGVAVHDTIQIPGGLFWPQLRSINARTLKQSITDIIAECEIDLLIASSPMPLPERLNIPVVGDFIDEHASYWRDVRGRSDLAIEIEREERRLADVADRHVVVSGALGEKLATWGHRSEYIPNGFDLSRVFGGDRAGFRGALGLDDRSFLVGYIGYFGEFSGLVRAVESACGWEKNVHLVIAGDGPQLKVAKHLAIQKDLSNIHFLGWLDNTKDFFAGIDAGLLPFDVINFTSWASPIKLFEYLGAGKPVISTPLAEVKRMSLDGVIVVEPSAVGISKGVEILRTSKGSKVATANVHHHEWHRLASRFATVIESVL